MGRPTGQRWAIELALQLVLAVVLYLGLRIPWAHRTQVEFLDDRREAIYEAVLSLHVTLLGFTLAALTITLGFIHTKRFEAVRRAGHLKTLLERYVSALRSEAIATLLALVALLIDRDTAPNKVMTALALGSTVIAAWRMGQVLWVTERVARVAATPAARGPGE